MESCPRSIKAAISLAFTVFAIAAMAALSARAEPTVPRKSKVLFFSKASGFEHEAIKLVMKDGRPGYAYAVLRELGEKNNIEFTFSKDGGLFTPEYLAKFDAFFFYTSGDLTLVRNSPVLGDRNPPMTPAGKLALLRTIEAGKGFVGVHGATDTFHSPGNRDHGPARNRDDGFGADPFVKMVGGEFIRHDAQQVARVIVADSAFPGMAAVPRDYAPMEEWYSLKNFAPDLHVLLVQDTSKMVGPSYARPPFPLAWARQHGQGRVFYTSMGHREDVWTSHVFQTMITSGLEWALRRVDADIAPNLKAVAPEAGILPVYVAPTAPAQKKPAATTEN